MGNLATTDVYIPKNIHKNSTITSLISSFHLINPDDVLEMINKRIIPPDDYHHYIHPLTVIEDDIKEFIKEGHEKRVSWCYNELVSELRREDPDGYGYKVKYRNPDAHTSGCLLSPCIQSMKPSRREKHLATCAICPRYYAEYLAWCDSNHANLAEARQKYQDVRADFPNEMAQLTQEATQDMEHDLNVLEELLGELQQYMKSTILISPELAGRTITLGSDLDVSVKVEDVVRLLAYNTGLSVAMTEFEKHLAEAKKRD